MEEGKINATENTQESVQDTTVDNVVTFDPTLLLGSNSDTLLLNAPIEKLKPKGYTKKELKLLHKKNYFMGGKDIKYSGPLSYRYLRALAWLSFAVTQILFLHNHIPAAYESVFASSVGTYFVDLFADMSMPLFLVASFAFIMQNRKSCHSITITYFVYYIGIALGEVFILRRYVLSIITELGLDQDTVSKILGALLGQKVQVNIFADLFILTAFNFFLNAKPKKWFVGKKLIILRLMSIIPLAFAVFSFVVRYKVGKGTISLPIDVYAFLTTKSPMVYGIFIFLSLWTKRRERMFKKFGGTDAEYNQFLHTKKNSWAYSLEISKLFFWFAFLDFLMYIFGFVQGALVGLEDAVVESYLAAIGIGQCIGLGFAIPFILLFSYNKIHKDSTLDIIIPVVGVGLFAFVYIEGLYEVASSYASTIAAAFA